MKNIKIYLLNVLFLAFLTSCLTAETTDNPAEDQAYRYTLKVKFKKVKTGEDMQLIYYPLPRSNDYQIVSNIDTHGGQIINNPNSIEKYVRYSITEDLQPAEGEWGEVILEFDCILPQTEYSYAKIGPICEYDTTTDIYKRYTSSYYEYIDTENPEIMRISDKLWKKSTDVYDYAKKCSDYINDHFNFQDNPGMWNSMADIIRLKGGDCGNLSSIFISLARCKKIPARYVITRGHAWAEFYLEKNGWIPVDPTFKTFGKVTDAYGLIRSNELVYKIEISENRYFDTDYLVKNHIFYPSHMPFECDEEIILTPINN